MGEELLKKYPDGFNAGHIAGKGEKRRERGKQAPIHGFEGVPVKDQKRRHDDKQPRLICTARSTMATADKRAGHTRRPASAPA